ncbi:PREDICTED: oxidoreductase HTATIP2-like isoform X2 [Amphimedon queenslandica]|uniref:Protein HTATIP2 n=1 Tax=Amphimedon queenslandica TaxID=400682 RepID=A0AAN0IWM7_AMPQE|nr:PREDICTED: oxidoreductase HTATIP2-like isoform X2 [Amphimedon queenslandica]|eukprot:XP_019849185.1 PREDICTED: oxidoreductase HTATIP2-like isoform X2 [Amphimedon queenslandica]
MSEEVDPISTEQTEQETQNKEPASTETAAASKDPPPPSTEGEDSSKDPAPPSTEGEDSSKDPPPPSTEGEDSSKDPAPASTEGEGSSTDPPPPSTDPPVSAAAEAPPPTGEASPKVERPQLNMVGVVIGGTGATGRSLVSYLLRSKKEEWSKVILFNRRAIDNIPDVNLEEEKSSGRLVEHVVGDMFTVPEEEIKSKCEGADVFFCCLGTTRRAAGSAEAFVRIDRDLVVRFAEQAKAAGVPHFSLLTSYGSNPNSFFLYTKTKGQVEEAVRQLNFSYTTILRPVLIGRGEDRRLAEKIAGIFFKALPVETLAQAMAIDAYQYKGSSTGATATDNVVIMTNSDIYRTAQAGQ